MLKDAMPLTVAFHARTGSIFSSMQSRFKQKVDKRGRVMRVGRLVPFTLSEFRVWMLEKLGGKPEGSVRCEYCNTPLFADTLRIDHKVPGSRGGSLGFDNLACCCARCNAQKGALSDTEFRAFQVALGDLLNRGLLHPDGFADIQKRLAGQATFFRQFKKKAEPKPPGLLVEGPEQQKLLTKRLPVEDNSW